MSDTHNKLKHQKNFNHWKISDLVVDLNFCHSKPGVGNLLLVTGQMSSVQLFGGPEFSLIL